MQAKNQEKTKKKCISPYFLCISSMILAFLICILFYNNAGFTELLLYF